jgi:F-type H+-transporting ATPase subunit b
MLRDKEIGMLERNKWRLKRLALALTMVLVFGLFMASPAMADEVKPDVMPHLDDPQTYAQAVWTVVIFIILLAILYPTAWKNVLGGLKKREEKIRAAIADADAARTKGEVALKDYNSQLATAESQVRELLSKATIEAEKIAAGIKMHAQQEAEVIKEKAIKEIESNKTAALNEIYEQTAVLATSVAEKILRRNLNAADQRDLVKQSLDELSTLHA